MICKFFFHSLMNNIEIIRKQMLISRKFHSSNHFIRISFVLLLFRIFIFIAIFCGRMIYIFWVFDKDNYKHLGPWGVRSSWNLKKRVRFCVNSFVIVASQLKWFSVQSHKSIFIQPSRFPFELCFEDNDKMISSYDLHVKIHKYEQ